jgi:hypothetical protein
MSLPQSNRLGFGTSIFNHLVGVLTNTGIIHSNASRTACELSPDLSYMESI